MKELTPEQVYGRIFPEKSIDQEVKEFKDKFLQEMKEDVMETTQKNTEKI